MNPKITSISRGLDLTLSKLSNCRALYAALGLALATATAANAQISAINSAFIDPRVYDDVPAATLTIVSNYPSDISFTEQNVSSPTGFANRDIWYFSANGGSNAYQFQSTNYFLASFNVTLTGGTAGFDLEAGFIFSNPSGGFGGDLQEIVEGNGQVAQFGGPSYYPFSPSTGGYPGAGGSVSNYIEGETYTLGLNYVIDPKTGANAFQYSVNGQYAASSAGDSYFDLGAGSAPGNPGDSLGGYFQIGTVATNSTNMGEAIFSNISIAPVPILSIAQNASQSVIYWPGSGSTNFTLQSTTNLSGSWTTVSNSTAIQGYAVPNSSTATFFRVVGR